MSRFKVPDTYVIIFFVLLLCAVSTWIVPGGNPQTWQVFSALYKGFNRQSGIIALVLIIGGAFWVVNGTEAIDVGIRKFIVKTRKLEKYPLLRRAGVGNIIIVMIMLLFGIFGAVLGMSEEVIPFVALVIPLAKSLGYDKMVGVCMVYVAAHVGFAGAMLNPFTVGVAQDMISVPLFSGIGYRTFCWALLMLVAFIFVLWYASKKRASVSALENGPENSSDKELSFVPCGKGAIVTFVLISISLVLFSVFYADECVLSIGQAKYSVPWLLWTVSILFVFSSLLLLRKDLRMYILNLLGFTIFFMVIGVMGYAWYLPEICALFLAMAIASGLSAGYTSDKIAREFIAGAKDIFGAALVIGFAAGIIVILEDGNVMDTMLTSIASALEDVGKIGALGVMYAIQTFINIFIPSATAKAAITMPVMAPFADLIGVSRQATVLAFQFGDGFTNMITPCSGVLMAVLSVAKISYADWFSFIWKFILVLIVLGFVLLIPTAFLNIPGF